MNIFECEKKAQDEGFDCSSFKAMFPAGELEVKWLDAHLGLLIVPYLGEDRFITVSTLNSIFPDLECYDFKVN